MRQSITRLSYSMIRSYLDCPKGFYFRYVRELPTILKGKMICGRCYHRGVAYALKTKMSGSLAKPEEIQDLVSDLWEAELSERIVYDELDEPKVEAKEVDWEEDDPGRLKDVTIKLAVAYLVKVVPKLYPVSVEQRIEAVVAGVPFVGYPDCIVSSVPGESASGLGVIDHKFSKKRMPQEQVDRDPQMTAYAALLGKPIWCAFHQALDQKTLDINICLSERGDGDIEWFGGLVSGVWHGIQSGVFPPNPLTWRCGSNCSYEIECRVLMEE